MNDESWGNKIDVTRYFACSEPSFKVAAPVARGARGSQNVHAWAIRASLPFSDATEVTVPGTIGALCRRHAISASRWRRVPPHSLRWWHPRGSANQIPHGRGARLAEVYMRAQDLLCGFVFLACAIHNRVA